MSRILVLAFVLFVICIMGCKSDVSVANTDPPNSTVSATDNSKAFHTAVKTHLNALQNRNMDVIRSEMPPKGDLMLIRPNTQLLRIKEKYVDYHEGWFQDTTWSIEAQITDSFVGDDIGLAYVDLDYFATNQQGKRYVNKMNMTIGMKRFGDKWHLISDHTTSVEKKLVDRLKSGGEYR